MYLRSVAFIFVSLFGASFCRLHHVVKNSDAEDVPTCGRHDIKKCNEGSDYLKMKETIMNAPIVEGKGELLEPDPIEVETAVKALHDLVRYMKHTCKNCLEEKTKKEFCDRKNMIYQGLFDWHSDTSNDNAEPYCPTQSFVCGKEHFDRCNGDDLEQLKKALLESPREGGEVAFDRMHQLMRYFSYGCKSCVKHANAKHLCELRKPILEGIVDYDNSKYVDSTKKFCEDLYSPNLSAPYPKCADVHKDCASWASTGKCLKNPEYMKHQCLMSCGACE